MSEGALHKYAYTPSVDRGIRYAITALEDDSSDGVLAEPASITRAEDLLAAAAWLRYQRDKHAEDIEGQAK